MTVKLKSDDIFSIPNGWLDIPRANNPKLKLSVGALRLLADVVFRLKVTKLKYVIYEVKDLCAITNTNEKPLKVRSMASILKQLLDILYITELPTFLTPEAPFIELFLINLQSGAEDILNLNQDFYNNFIPQRRKEDVTYH